MRKNIPIHNILNNIDILMYNSITQGRKNFIWCSSAGWSSEKIRTLFIVVSFLIHSEYSTVSNVIYCRFQIVTAEAKPVEFFMSSELTARMTARYCISIDNLAEKAGTGIHLCSICYFNLFQLGILWQIFWGRLLFQLKSNFYFFCFQTRHLCSRTLERSTHHLLESLHQGATLFSMVETPHSLTNRGGARGGLQPPVGGF